MGMPSRVAFTRTSSVAEVIEGYLDRATVSVDAALYRLSHPLLAEALARAAARGVRVRVVLDRGKYRATAATRELVARLALPVRVLGGRRSGASKMHHKFAVVDTRVVLTGSYNWTFESENTNYENFVVLETPEDVEPHVREFELLWEHAKEIQHLES